MLEPKAFLFENGEIVPAPQGCLKIEFQTPDEYVESVPFTFVDDVEWGDNRVRFYEMADPDGASFYYAIIEQYKDRRPDPQWAIIQIKKHELDKFRDDFRLFCEKKE